MADWSTLAVALLGGGVVGAFVSGAVEVIKTFANRKLTQATAEEKQAATVEHLSDTALEQVRQALAAVKEARDEARGARVEADEARREASEARREATDARREAMVAVARMRQLTTAILSPYASIEGLRAMVADPPSQNGSSAVRV